MYYSMSWFAWSWPESVAIERIFRCIPRLPPADQQDKKKQSHQAVAKKASHVYFCSRRQSTGVLKRPMSNRLYLLRGYWDATGWLAAPACPEHIPIWQQPRYPLLARGNSAPSWRSALLASHYIYCSPIPSSRLCIPSPTRDGQSPVRFTVHSSGVFAELDGLCTRQYAIH
jgi:hypothetical protein